MTRRSPTPPWAPLAGAIAVYLGLLAVLIFTGLRQTDGVFVYAQDDPYIHLTLARTLAEHGVWGIRPTEFASASSSPLWTLLLATSWTLGIRAVWWPLALNAASGIALLAVGHRILRGNPVAFPALVAVVLVTPMPTLALIGMEHTLQILVVLAFAWVIAGLLAGESGGFMPGLKPRPTAEIRASMPRGKPRPAAAVGLGLASAAILAAVLVATRYEGLFVVAAAALLLAAARRLTAAITVGASAMVPVVAFAAYSMMHGGLPLPASVLMKSGPGRFVTLGSGIAAVLSDWFSVLNLFGRPPELVLTIAVLIALAFTARRSDSPVPRATTIARVFLIAMLLHVCLVKLEWFYRYEAYLLALGVVSLALLIGRAPDLISGPSAVRGAAWTMTVVLLGVPLAVRSLSALATAPTAMRNVYEQQYQMARFVRDHCPPAGVAVNDIGAVTWLSDCPVLDIVGLGTPAVAELKRHKEFNRTSLEALVNSRHVPFVMIYEKVFQPVIPSTWTLVGELQIQNNVAVSEDTVGFFVTSSGDPGALRAELDTFASSLPAGVTYKPR